MSSNTKFVEFTLEWKIQSSDSIKNQPLGFRKDFVTAYNNIPLRWSVRQAPVKLMNGEQLGGFYIYYDEGPLEKINGVEYVTTLSNNIDVCILKPNGSFVVLPIHIKHSAKRGEGQCYWLFHTYSDAFRAKYNMANADRLVFQFTVKIPIDAFSYVMLMPIRKPFAPWAVDLFNTIDDPENSSFSDAVVVSSDDIVFYCHKAVIAVQSEPLATMLRDPLTTQTEGDQNPPATKTNESASLDVLENQSKKKGEYPFPTMASASLKSMLEYLYTGKVTTANLSVSQVIEVADAAEQYALEPLKKWCGAEMWKRVVEEPPREAFQIAAFANLHDDMKWLKYRAFDVIVEKWDGSTCDLAALFAGARWKELRDQFNNYMTCRLRPYVKP